MATASGADETLAALAREELQAAQRAARYPTLLFGPWRYPEGVIQHHMRAGTQLVTSVLRHDALTSTARAALGRFRLQQFILCGWYNELALRYRGVRSDPALDCVPPDTLHCLVGDQEARLLAYISLQPAGSCAPTTGKGPQGRRAAATTHALSQRTLANRNRLWFPSELELFGPQVYSSLPKLRSLRVAQVRELTYLLRNRVIRPALALVAVLEAMHAALQLIARPGSQIRALIGHGEREARRVLYDIGVPMLYAPEAPSAPMKSDYYWSEEANTPGRFWPFVLAQDDVRAHPDLLVRLGDFLSSTDLRSWRSDLLRLRRASPPAAPSAFGSKGKTDWRWTPDPLLDIETSQRPALASAVMAAAQAGNDDHARQHA